MPPRYSTEGSTTLVIKNVIRQISEKEGQYKESIKRNNVMCKQAAALIQNLENDLPGMMDGVEGLGDLAAFLDAQKQAVLKVVADNVDADYEELIRSGWQERKDTLAATESAALDVNQDANYREIVQMLGLAATHATNVNSSAGNGNENDDDDIVVQRSQATGNAFKCPITARLMEDAVRNRVCGHSYSKEGIQAHMRRDLRCPVTGCTNQNLKLADLEDDVATQMAVRREQRKEGREKELQASQANDLVDSDED
jgi:SUMO ligase MMS21 Smc5/6 complex component